MCCFSPVSAPAGLLASIRAAWASRSVQVADTCIFARLLDDGAQGLVYSMKLSVGGDVAMILPLPVVPGAGEDGATFVSLERHPGFFDDVRALYFAPQPLSVGGAKGGSRGLALPQLRVQEVGSFEASFVPTMRDFARLDARFRLPDTIWRALGGYEDWGFAVFKLEAGRRKQIHPMAMRFHSRQPRRLFFPTVHVHDGEVRETARFDHSLYYQLANGAVQVAGDEPSTMVPPRDYEGLVAKGRTVFHRALRGVLPNQDTWIATPESS